MKALKNHYGFLHLGRSDEFLKNCCLAVVYIGKQLYFEDDENRGGGDEEEKAKMNEQSEEQKLSLSCCFVQ